jgi:hypothetical protein
VTDPNSREERKNNPDETEKKGRDRKEPGGQVGKDKSPDRQPDLQGDSSRGGNEVPRKNPGGNQKDTKRG